MMLGAMTCFANTSAADLGLGVALNYLYDDNVNKSGASKNTDTATGAKLTLQTSTQLSNLSAGLNYGTGIVKYNKFSEFNHEDHTLNQYLNYQGAFVGWRTELKYLGSHDERGAPGTTTNFSVTPVLFQSLGGSVQVNYDGGGELGDANVSVGVTATRYADPVQDYRNSNSYNLGGVYSNKLTGKTNYESKIGIQQFSSATSSTAQSDRSFTAVNTGIGVKWAATGKLTGHALVGVGWSRAASSKYGGGMNGYTDIDCVWQRKSYSSASLYIKRTVAAAASQDDVMSINNTGGIGLNHFFSDRLSASAGVNVTLNEFKNNKSSIFYAFSMGTKFSLLSKLTMSFTISSTTGGNGFSQLNYVSNTFMANVATSI